MEALLEKRTTTAANQRIETIISGMEEEREIEEGAEVNDEEIEEIDFDEEEFEAEEDDEEEFEDLDFEEDEEEGEENTATN